MTEAAGTILYPIKSYVRIQDPTTKVRSIRINPRQSGGIQAADATITFRPDTASMVAPHLTATNEIIVDLHISEMIPVLTLIEADINPTISCSTGPGIPFCTIDGTVDKGAQPTPGPGNITLNASGYYERIQSNIVQGVDEAHSNWANIKLYGPNNQQMPVECYITFFGEGAGLPPCKVTRFTNPDAIQIFLAFRYSAYETVSNLVRNGTELTVTYQQANPHASITLRGVLRLLSPTPVEIVVPAL